MAFEDIRKGSVADRDRALEALATQGTRGVEAFRRARDEVTARNSSALATAAADTAGGVASSAERQALNTLVGGPGGRTVDRLNVRQADFESDIARQSAGLGAYLDRITGAVDVTEAGLLADQELQKQLAARSGGGGGGGGVKSRDSNSVTSLTNKGNTLGEILRQQALAENAPAKALADKLSESNQRIQALREATDRAAINRRFPETPTVNRSGSEVFFGTAGSLGDPRTTESRSATAKRVLGQRDEGRRLARLNDFEPQTEEERIASIFAGELGTFSGSNVPAPADPSAELDAFFAGGGRGLPDSGQGAPRPESARDRALRELEQRQVQRLLRVPPSVQEQNQVFASLLKPGVGQGSVGAAIGAGQLPDTFEGAGTPDFQFALQAADQLGIDPILALTLFNSQADQARVDKRFKTETDARSQQLRRAQVDEDIAYWDATGFTAPDSPTEAASRLDLQERQQVSQAADGVTARINQEVPGAENRVVTGAQVERVAETMGSSITAALDLFNDNRFQEALTILEEEGSLDSSRDTLLLTLDDLKNDPDIGALFDNPFVESVLVDIVGPIFGGSLTDIERSGDFVLG